MDVHNRNRYQREGCRCERCVEAQRVYVAAQRARKRGRVAALPAGASVHVFLMCVLDERNSAEVKVTWVDAPGRSKRRSTRYSVKDQLQIESGWPGNNPEL